MFAISVGEGAELRPIEPWQAEELLAHVERAREYAGPWVPFTVKVTDVESARAHLQHFAERQAAEQRCRHDHPGILGDGRSREGNDNRQLDRFRNTDDHGLDRFVHPNKGEFVWIADPRVPHTGTRELYLRDMGRSRVAYIPWDIDRTFWDVLSVDHGQLLRNAIAWAPLSNPESIAVEGSAPRNRAWSTSQVLVIAAGLLAPGVVVGAIILSVVNNYLLPDVLFDLPGKVGLAFDLSEISSGIYGAILVVVMLLRPQGLMPARLRTDLSRGTRLLGRTPPRRPGTARGSSRT